jgi:hypothetical protein
MKNKTLHHCKMYGDFPGGRRTHLPKIRFPYFQSCVKSECCMRYELSILRVRLRGYDEWLWGSAELDWRGPARVSFCTGTALELNQSPAV